MSEVTQILSAIEEGKPAAAEELLPVVYGELRRLAAQKMASERADHTLNATALVHEAYVRLVGSTDGKQWSNRGHFFAAAAEAMRRILIDHARNRKRLKRGGHRSRGELPDFEVGIVDEDLLSLDEALQRLADEDEQSASLVKLRCFAGLSLGEAAAVLGLPRRTADRRWAFARAWLYKELRGNAER